MIHARSKYAYEVSRTIPNEGTRSSDNGIITPGEALILGDAIIYLRMSDFRDEDFMTFVEREQQLRDFAIGSGIPRRPHGIHYPG